MFKSFFQNAMIFVSILGFIGLSAELAFTDMSVDRTAMVGSILTLQTIAILMILAGAILQRRKLVATPRPARRHRTRKRRLPLA